MSAAVTWIAKNVCADMSSMNKVAHVCSLLFRKCTLITADFLLYIYCISDRIAEKVCRIKMYGVIKWIFIIRT